MKTKRAKLKLDGLTVEQAIVLLQKCHPKSRLVSHAGEGTVGSVTKVTQGFVYGTGEPETYGMSNFEHAESKADIPDDAPYLPAVYIE
jgi:hypothetical protein